MDDVYNLVLSAIQSAGFWLIIALILTMVAMQGIKVIVKHFLANNKYTKFILSVISFSLGYACGIFFLEGEDKYKWAIFIGIINPTVYYGLVQYAYAKNKMVMLSILKMRPLKRLEDGSLTIDYTDTV